MNFKAMYLLTWYSYLVGLPGHACQKAVGNRIEDLLKCIMEKAQIWMVYCCNIFL